MILNNPATLFFGFGRYGKAMAHYLEKTRFSLLYVDFDLNEVRNWRNQGQRITDGDASDLAFVGELPLKGVKGVDLSMQHYNVH